VVADPRAYRPQPLRRIETRRDRVVPATRDGAYARRRRRGRTADKRNVVRECRRGFERRPVNQLAGEQRVQPAFHAPPRSNRGAVHVGRGDGFGLALSLAGRFAGG